MCVIYLCHCIKWGEGRGKGGEVEGRGAASSACLQ